MLGLLGPLLTDAEVAFVKGAYRRPLTVGAETVPEGGGRVTELLARPLLNLHVPELAGIVQPLAGEVAARRALLEALPFPVGYGVEIAKLIDALRHAGLDALAQVDLGERRNAPPAAARAERDGVRGAGRRRAPHPRRGRGRRAAARAAARGRLARARPTSPSRSARRCARSALSRRTRRSSAAGRTGSRPTHASTSATPTALPQRSPAPRDREHEQRTEQRQQRQQVAALDAPAIPGAKPRNATSPISSSRPPAIAA